MLTVEAQIAQLKKRIRQVTIESHREELIQQLNILCDKLGVTNEHNNK